MKSINHFVMVIVFSIPFGVMSQEPPGIIRITADLLQSCDKSDYRQYEEFELSGRRFSLAASCKNPGEKGVFYLSPDGSAYLIGAIEKSDPGIERFQEFGPDGSGIVIYTNIVEPTGDEETYYVSLIDATEKFPVMMGSAWSFSEPKSFVENGNRYVGLSVNSFGFSDPEAPGWPVVFHLSNGEMVYTPISKVPRYACKIATEFDAYLGGDVRAHKEARHDFLSAGIDRLREYCPATTKGK